MEHMGFGVVVYVYGALFALILTVGTVVSAIEYFTDYRFPRNNDGPSKRL